MTVAKKNYINNLQFKWLDNKLYVTSVLRSEQTHNKFEVWKHGKRNIAFQELFSWEFQFFDDILYHEKTIWKEDLKFYANYLLGRWR